MNWWKQFKAKACSTRLAGTTKSDVLEEILENLIHAGLLLDSQRGSARKALQTREDLASTGIGMGVAVPHVELKGISTAICSLSVHPDGVEWHAVDGAPVHVLFTVLRPDRAGESHDPGRHLEMMRWIAKLARDPDFRSFAQRAKTKTDLVNLLKEMSAV